MSEKSSASSQETRIIKDALIRITPSEPFHPPKDRVNTERFGKDAESIALIIGLACEWINSPILEDSFEDHGGRRMWEDGLEEMDRDWLDQNKLGGNQWASTHLQLGLLKKLVDAHEPDLGVKIGEEIKDLHSVIDRLKRYKDEGSAAREAYLAAIEDLDQMTRATISLITG